MFEYVYQWIETIAFYLVILTIVIQLIPNNSYKQYIRFFIGLILILMLVEPVWSIFGMKESFQKFYDEARYEQRMREIEQATKYLEDFSFETQ